MLGPSSPASSVAAPAPAPTTTTPPMVAVYNIGIQAENFRARDEKSWQNLAQELQFLYNKTGLVFIQEAGPVSEKKPAQRLLDILRTVEGGQQTAQTRLTPVMTTMYNAIVLWDTDTWRIDAREVLAVKTWGEDIPKAERKRKAWRWHHLGNSIGIVTALQ